MLIPPVLIQLIMYRTGKLLADWVSKYKHIFLPCWFFRQRYLWLPVKMGFTGQTLVESGKLKVLTTNRLLAHFWSEDFACLHCVSWPVFHCKWERDDSNNLQITVDLVLSQWLVCSIWVQQVPNKNFGFWKKN